jgi:hypothetical protein
MIGPDSELPVKGSAPVPVLEFARVRADVEVEPSTAVMGEIVVDGATVEPSEPTDVLDTVVDGDIVVDVVLVELAGNTEVLVVAPVVVVVAPVVVVVLADVVVVEGEQADTNGTEVDADAWKPSVHVACNDNMTSPVNPPATIVVADVWALLATSE